MNRKIDHISINDVFWIQIKDKLITFGYKGLPKDTHFTISLDDRSPDINFHVTKNVSNSTNKPKITIVTINKKLLEEGASTMVLAMLNKLLKPLDINEHINKFNYKLGFVSFDSLQDIKTSSLLKSFLINSFKGISRFRKRTRLKIEGDFEKQIENVSTSGEMRNSILHNLVGLSDEFQNSVDGGIIVSKDNALQVIRLNDNWFTIRTELKPFDLMLAFVNPILANQIIWKTKKALISVKQATSYEETKHLDIPFRLVRQQTIETISTNQPI